VTDFFVYCVMKKAIGFIAKHLDEDMLKVPKGAKKIEGRLFS